MCASIEDESRFREMIEGWIHEGDVPPFPAFVKETKARKRARAKKWKGEAEEAAKAQQEKGTGEIKSSICSLLQTVVVVHHCSGGFWQSGILLPRPMAAHIRLVRRISTVQDPPS